MSQNRWQLKNMRYVKFVIYKIEYETFYKFIKRKFIEIKNEINLIKL